MNLPLLRVMFLGPIDVQEEDQTNLTFLNQDTLKKNFSSEDKQIMRPYFPSLISFKFELKLAIVITNMNFDQRITMINHSVGTEFLRSK